MTAKAQSLMPLSDEGTLPLNPKDAAALVVVTKVFDHIHETGDMIITHALEATGVHYHAFYRACRRPAVQAAVLAE
jgi:hypothetical protein